MGNANLLMLTVERKVKDKSERNKSKMKYMKQVRYWYKNLHRFKPLLLHMQNWKVAVNQLKNWQPSYHQHHYQESQ